MKLESLSTVAEGQLFKAYFSRFAAASFFFASESDSEPNRTSQTDQSTAEENQLDGDAESPTPIQSTNRIRAKV